MKKEKNELITMSTLLRKDEKIEKNTKSFEKIMFLYSVASKELQTKLEIIKDEFKLFYDYDLIDHMQTRIKKPDSIVNKMKSRGLDITYQNMIENINDIAGIRVICPLKKDVFSVRDLVRNIPGVRILKEKDYINNPKKSGYSSYHMILEVPISLSNKHMYVKVEVQIRTMAMDFWANLEHKMKYKAKEKVDKKTSKEWINYAKIINKLDNKIMLMNNL